MRSAISQPDGDPPAFDLPVFPPIPNDADPNEELCAELDVALPAIPDEDDTDHADLDLGSAAGIELPPELENDEQDGAGLDADLGDWLETASDERSALDDEAPLDSDELTGWLELPNDLEHEDEAPFEETTGVLVSATALTGAGLTETGTPLSIQRSAPQHRVSYELEGDFRCMTPYASGLLLAGRNVEHIDNVGERRELCHLPSSAVAVIANESASWAVLALTTGALWRVDVATGHAEAIELPPGYRGREAVRLLQRADRRLVYEAGSDLWQLDPRGRRLDPAVVPPDLLELIAPSGEFGIQRTSAGRSFVHLDSGVTFGFEVDFTAELCATGHAGWLLVSSLDGQLRSWRSTGQRALHSTLGARVLAATLAVNSEGPCAWLALTSTRSGVEVVELELETGRAELVHHRTEPLEPDDDVELVHDPRGRSSYLRVGRHLTALRRLEA